MDTAHKHSVKIYIINYSKIGANQNYYFFYSWGWREPRLSQTSAFETVCILTPVLVPLFISRGAKWRERPLLVKGGIMGEKWPVNLACDSDFYVNRRVL
jgi:hypothetical protein